MNQTNQKVESMLVLCGYHGDVYWQVVIGHLKSQMTRTQVDTEALAALRIREASMETQLRQLLDELKDAKKSFNPVSCMPDRV